MSVLFLFGAPQHRATRFNLTSCKGLIKRKLSLAPTPRGVLKQSMAHLAVRSGNSFG